MSQLRRDPILGRWVIISSDRTLRPTDFRPRRDFRPPEGFCPFCSGNEYTTPPELLAVRDEGGSANGTGWSLRVVPNKFPALVIEGSLSPTGGDGMFQAMNGIGAHEVVIETPEHNATLPSMTTEQIRAVLGAFGERVTDLARDKRFVYAMVFKNHGPSAGATLEHPHSQLIALPVLPKQIDEELKASLMHYRQSGQCVYCAMAAEELSSRSRVIIENDHFVAFCPFAPAFSFETWILPKKHHSSYEHSGHLYESLAGILKELLAKMEGALGMPDYNFVLHNAPLRANDLAHYHWHLEIIPRTGEVAGFEWGSGFFINPTPPEEAAAFLRDAAPV